MKTGWIFLGAYALVLGLIGLFVATAGGHMSSLLFVFAALPWPLAGHWLFGQQGLWYATLAGVPLNAAILFAAGYGISRWRAARSRKG